MSNTKKKNGHTKRKRPGSVNYEEFVKLWLSSDTVGTVARKLGIQLNSASAIAAKLRKSGVKLRKFVRRARQPIDVKQLNRLAGVR